MKWRSILHRARAIGLALLLLLILKPQWPQFGEEEYQLEAIIGQRQFDFLIWEFGALSTKVQALSTESYQAMNASEQADFVIAYLTLLGETQRLEREISALYTNPDINDPDAASQSLQNDFAQKRALVEEKRPLAEAIVQDQVGQILVEEGFEVGGRVWPPVIMHMSPLPSFLMVSPRDRIERLHSYTLINGLPTPDMDEIETAVYDDLALSGLVVPIGGLGTFPAMIQETTNINWLVEVTAHEWSHHWMGFYPIGVNYLTDPQVRIMNETTASIIDREVANQVIERFYPEFVPPPPPENPAPPPEPEPDASPPFDFRAEMAETRIEVDRLLAEGEIDAAEAYMEARRITFVDNGYNIRKLNQAYFAFYGAYAAQPGGATGEDPVGPAVREVRALSPTLREFMDNMAQLGSFAELEALIETLNSSS